MKGQEDDGVVSKKVGMLGEMLVDKSIHVGCMGQKFGLMDDSTGPWGRIWESREELRRRTEERRREEGRIERPSV